MGNLENGVENSGSYKLFLETQNPITGIEPNYWNEWNIPPSADKRWIIERYSKGLRPYGSRQGDFITEKNKEHTEKINHLVEVMNKKIIDTEHCDEVELKAIINVVRNLIIGDNYAWFQKIDMDKSNEIVDKL